MSFFTKPIRILLVNPETPMSYWGFQKSVGFLGARAAHAPLPLITLAALLPRDWSLRLVDLNIEPLTDADLSWATAVFVTGMIFQRQSVAAVLERCASCGKPTVVGGPFVSTTPEAPELKTATSLFIGEAEGALDDLIADIRADRLRPRYEAVGRPELALSPTPRFDLLDRRAYVAMSVQVSRGCPHACEFCNVQVLFGRRPRYKSPAQVQAELQAIFVTGFRGNVFIVDDNFIGDFRQASATLDAIIAWQQARGRPFLFYTEADVRLADHDDLVRQMVAAGFFCVFLGFESPSEDCLKEARKHQNLGRDPAASVRKLRELGLLVYGGFIVGFDADDAGCFQRVLEFVEACKIDFAMAGMLTAIPGTPLEKRLKAEGRLAVGAEGDPFDLPNIRPKRLTRLELVRGYRRLIERLYKPSKYFERALAAVKEWRSGLRRRQTWREILAVPLSLLRQGLLSSYRWAYWKFMFSVLFTNPKKIPRAFAQAISGHHFFLYTRKVVLPRLRRAEAQLAAEEA